MKMQLPKHGREQSKGRHRDWQALLEREHLHIYLYHQPRGLNI